MKPNLKSPWKRLSDRAFSLIELLVVIAIILILAGLLLAAVQQVMQNAMKAKARVDVKMFSAAVDAYYATYGKWPLCGDGANVNDPDAVYNLLSGGDGYAGLQGSGNGASDGANDCYGHPSANPKHIVFISLTKKNLCAFNSAEQSFVMMDPWGNQYYYAYDTNGSGVIDNGDYIWGPGVWFCGGGDSQWTWNGPTGIRRPFVIWSDGPDKQNGWGDPNRDCGGGYKCGVDDIFSW